LIKNQKEPVLKKPLYGMFTDIPPRYDLINRLITLGMDKGWRQAAARACISSKPQRMLDLCCGTGDLSITVANLVNYAIEVKGLDYSQPMLDIAAKKAALVKGKAIDFKQGDASKLPFPAAYFDCVGISFAFRNITYKNQLVEDHLSEIVRVLKPGGRCIIVESSQPSSGFIRAVYHLYLYQYVCRIGSWLSGNKGAYRYLAESASHYFSPAQMQEFLMGQGFKEFSCRPLFFGAAAVYIATK
jgi:demethylmenaquinone methyltransferase / 2-methoxy-6-polyprenyl-1,4-benzoquinol methylase